MAPPDPSARAVRESAQAGSTDVLVNDRAAPWAVVSLTPFSAQPAGAWLALLAQRIANLRTAAIYVPDAGGQPSLLAGWPQDAPVSDEMAESALEGLARGVPLALSSIRGFHLVCPLSAGTRGVVVAEVPTLVVPALQAALDDVQWGAGWLEAALSRDAGAGAMARAERLELAARLSEDVARTTDAMSAASILAAGIAAAFPAMLVSVGLHRRGDLSIAAQASLATPRLRGDDDLLDAMATAIRSRHTQVLPAFSPLVSGGPELDAGVAAVDQGTDGPGDPEANPGAARHEGPASAGVPTCGIAIPMLVLDVAAGAIVIESPGADGIDPEVVATLETIALQAAPLIQAKPMSRPVQVTPGRRLFVALFGPVRLRSKLLMVAVLAAALVLIGATASYTVPVTGIVEGAPYRVVTAPFGGPLAEVAVRRGDPVMRGQLLARLDDAELQAERVRLGAEREEVLAALREAKSNRDSPVPAGLDIRLKELDVRKRTLEERITRARVVSPVEGVVVGGVALGSAGTAVPQGEALFEVAPVDSYRLILWVDRREAAQIREGQSGTLHMASGNQDLGFTVRRLTSVSARVGGQSRIRVEAQPQGFLGAAVEPGTEGNGSIDVGRRKLVWVWWRDFQREWRGL